MKMSTAAAIAALTKEWTRSSKPSINRTHPLPDLRPAEAEDIPTVPYARVPMRETTRRSSTFPFPFMDTLIRHPEKNLFIPFAVACVPERSRTW